MTTQPPARPVDPQVASLRPDQDTELVQPVREQRCIITVRGRAQLGFSLGQRRTQERPVGVAL